MKPLRQRMLEGMQIVRDFSDNTQPSYLQLCDQFSIPARTLKRWRTWWRQDFPATPFWQSMGERFIPPLSIERLPQSLLERFDGDSMTDRLMHALRLIVPLSMRIPIR